MKSLALEPIVATLPKTWRSSRHRTCATWVVSFDFCMTVFLWEEVVLKILVLNCLYLVTLATQKPWHLNSSGTEVDHWGWDWLCVFRSLLCWEHLPSWFQTSSDIATICFIAWEVHFLSAWVLVFSGGIFSTSFCVEEGESTDFLTCVEKLFFFF